jgi:hypothetical protein
VDKMPVTDRLGREISVKQALYLTYDKLFDLMREDVARDLAPRLEELVERKVMAVLRKELGGEVEDVPAPPPIQVTVPMLLAPKPVLDTPAADKVGNEDSRPSYSKLGYAGAKRMRALYRQGVSVATLMEQFRVTEQTVRACLNGKTYVKAPGSYAKGTPWRASSTRSRPSGTSERRPC